MINGAHSIIYSAKADADRAFFRDVLGLTHVDVGGGWLIFGLPPSEVAVHPADGDGKHELYLMCDDIEKTVAELQAKGVEFLKPISDAGFGLMASFKIPGGAELSIYQPKHPTAIQPPG